MVDIVKLTTRLDEHTGSADDGTLLLPQVVVIIQELLLSQHEMQLLEEFEASTSDTEDYWYEIKQIQRTMTVKI
jgi:hypothetical protein